MMCLKLMVLVSLVGCGSDEKVAKGEHVWKEQTKALDKAKAVEKTLMDSARQRLQQSNDQE